LLRFLLLIFGGWHSLLWPQYVTICDLVLRANSQFYFTLTKIKVHLHNIEMKIFHCGGSATTGEVIFHLQMNHWTKMSLPLQGRDARNCDIRVHHPIQR
jgi:hypothetical protein